MRDESGVKKICGYNDAKVKKQRLPERRVSIKVLLVSAKNDDARLFAPLHNFLTRFVSTGLKR